MTHASVFSGIGGPEVAATLLRVQSKEERRQTMNVNFLRLDPEDLYTCNHCQHHYIDIDEMTDRVLHKCHQHEKTGQYIINPMQTHYVNDCELWRSPFISDYRRRPDLENKLKKGGDQ